MSIFGEIFEEILVVPAYQLWQELFGEKKQEEEEEESERDEN
ncbi:unnamed protein product [marine sediment metagenome]|uniref:Uncharacterized protein n=1 Tax=marine sediment metagenome TaxID=412755 RepID=X1I768_9ZZZZ